jgi:hypothetical protein
LPLPPGKSEDGRLRKISLEQKQLENSFDVFHILNSIEFRNVLKKLNAGLTSEMGSTKAAVTMAKLREDARNLVS